MKEYAIDYQQNRNLLGSILRHAEFIGYDMDKSCWAIDDIFSYRGPGHMVFLGDEGVGSGFSKGRRTLLSLCDFFSLSKEDVKDSAKKMTMKEINEALGYEVEVVE